MSSISLDNLYIVVFMKTSYRQFETETYII